jgi:hypothetical protein
LEVAVGLDLVLYWAHLEKQLHQRQVSWEWPVGKVRCVHVELVFLALKWVMGAVTILWH